MPTAKTTLNPAYGQLKIYLQKGLRLDDPISFGHELPFSCTLGNGVFWSIVLKKSGIVVR